MTEAANTSGFKPIRSMIIAVALAAMTVVSVPQPAQAGPLGGALLGGVFGGIIGGGGGALVGGLIGTAIGAKNEERRRAYNSHYYRR